MNRSRVSSRSAVISSQPSAWARDSSRCTSSARSSRPIRFRRSVMLQLCRPVRECKDRAVDPILLILVRANAQEVGTTGAVANLELARSDVVDDVTREILEVRPIEIWPDIAQRTTDVGRNQV